MTYSTSLPSSSSMATGQDTSDFIQIDPTEDVSGASREDLEDRYLDLKDEVWRLRRMLQLDPATGEIPSDGGYSSRGGYLRHQRVAVFVDVQNLYHSAKRLFGQNISYGKLLRAAVGPRRLVRASAYVIEQPEIDQQSFFNHLRYTGYEIQKRELIERFDGSSKADWAIGMSRDILAMAEKVDAVVLASGNGSFGDLAPLLKANGVKFECVSFNEALSDILRQAADHYRLLDEEHLYSPE